MKKIGLLSLLFLGLNGFGQVWFDLGAKGGIGSGFLMNSTLNSDARFGQAAGFNYFFGGKVGVHFSDFIGITCDVDYGNYSYGFNQSEVPGLDPALIYKYRLGFSSINVLPAVRFTKEASYLELGPQFSFTNNQLIEDEAYGSVTLYAPDLLKRNLTGIVFGFGGHMIGNEVISLMMGLRFNYVFSNIIAETYEDGSFPYNNYPDVVSPGKTSPLNAQLVMEINYSLGYFVKASCGRRTAFLTF
jgi:hypothetical protein